MPPISVLILTFNEEANLAGCLRSCAWCDDVVVLDSMSTDGTRAIAAAAGARFHERAFDNYAAQRNAGLTQIHYEHAWVLMVDADERVTPALVDEMDRAIAAADPDTVLFRMRRKDYFLGRWLRRSSGYPSWFGRLVKLGRVRVAREVNEEYLADGNVGHLREHLIHHPFNKGIAYWIERHNRYSTMEAAAMLDARTAPLDWRAIAGLEPIARRRELKKLAYRLPLRPVIVFLYLFVVRGGFLDGRAGFAYSRMRAAYEMFIDLKVLESARRRRGEPV